MHETGKAALHRIKEEISRGVTAPGARIYADDVRAAIAYLESRQERIVNAIADYCAFWRMVEDLTDEDDYLTAQRLITFEEEARDRLFALLEEYR